jgi:SH3 domain protein
MKMRFWLAALSLVFPLTVTAATKYVTDHLVITLRTGQGNQFQIIKTLPSGTLLTVLEETTTGYTQVRTSDGTEGWVRTQYLSDDPPAAEELAKAQDKLAKLQDKLSKAQQELSDLQKQKTQLDSEHNKLLSENKTTNAELAKLTQIAAHPKELESENIDLREKFATMSDQFNLIKQENQVLKDRSKRNWFLAGALVVIIGIVIGLIIPKLRFRRKDSWDF